MELVNGRVIMEDALKNNYGIGAFNFINTETLKSILDSAEEKINTLLKDDKEMVDNIEVMFERKKPRK